MLELIYQLVCLRVPQDSVEQLRHGLRPKRREVVENLRPWPWQAVRPTRIDILLTHTR